MKQANEHLSKHRLNVTAYFSSWIAARVAVELQDFEGYTAVAPWIMLAMLFQNQAIELRIEGKMGK